MIINITSKEKIRLFLNPTRDDFHNPFLMPDMEKAVQRIYKNNRTVSYNYYPEIFEDIYFNGLTTCISSSCTGIDDANIIFGTVIDESLQNEMEVTVVATGVEE